MLKSEKLNWTIAIVGLVASLISIFAFLTGAQSIPGIIKKPEAPPVASSKSMDREQKADPTSQKKTVGTVVDRTLGGIGRAFTTKHHKNPDANGAAPPVPGAGTPTPSEAK